MGSTSLKDMNNEIFTRAQDWKYLVISPSTDNQDAIRKANPFRISNFLKKHCHGDSLREVKAINKGRQLLVILKNKETADILLKQNVIPGPNNSQIPISITESDKLGTKQGVFLCHNTDDMTDDEIIENLNASNADMKIVSIQRLKRKNEKGDWIDSSSVVVTMRCSEIPKEIRVGWMIQPMRPFIPDPMRCFRCNKLGHTSKRCNEKKEEERNCINCNQSQHTAPRVRCEREPKCANCNSSDHNSAFRGCPKYILEKRVNEIMVTRGYARREASAIAANEPIPTPNHQQRPPSLSERLKNPLPPPLKNNPQKLSPPKNAENIPLPESASFSDIEMSIEEKIHLTNEKINLVNQKIIEKRRLTPCSSEDEANLSRKEIKKMKKAKEQAMQALERQPPGTSSELNGQGKGASSSKNQDAKNKNKSSSQH